MVLQAGTRLGPYEILSAIGSGGMGEVYRARDPRLAREVAIKVLPEQFSKDPQALARFDREAKAVAALSHPNIVAIFDVGSHEGIHYVVTELLEGQTLRARLKLGPLNWRDVVEMGVAIAEGLAEAHSKGIVHRDLKPENIFLTSGGRVRILDFGLARILPAKPLGETTESMGPIVSGPLLGTIGYISPEQLHGSPGGPASDLFSLGCVLYELITAQRAFPGKVAAEVLSSILRDTPKPLGARAPEDLERVVMRCLEKLPERRFPSAHDLALKLATLTKVAAEPSHPRSIAVLPFVNVSGDPDGEYLSDGIAESIMNSLAQISQLKVAPRSKVFRYKGQEVDPQATGQALGVRVVLTGRVMQRGDTLVVRSELTDVDQGKQLWGERHSRSGGDIFAVEEEIARRISESLRVRLTGEDEKRLAKRFTEDSEAYHLYLRGRYYWVQRTPEGMHKGANYFQQAIAKDPAYALAFAGLADCYSVLTTYLVFPPKEGWARAKTAAAAAVALDPELPEGHASWGFIHFFGDWDWAGAEAEFRRAAEIRPSYWMNHAWYSCVLAAWARFEEAEQAIERAREYEPLSALVAYLSAMVAMFSRNYAEAEHRCLMGLESNPDFPLLRLWLGMVYERQTRYAESIRELEAAARLLQNAPLAAGSLAFAYALGGKREEAHRILNELLEQARADVKDPYYIALIYAGLGEVDAAFEWLDTAVKNRGAGTLPLMIQSDPRIDVLRSDGRFMSILERMNLKPMGISASATSRT